MKYIIKDMQKEEVIIVHATEEGVRKFAYEIVEQRDNDNGDRLGEEFKEILSKGFDDFSLEKAIEIMEMWEYSAEEQKTVR